MEVVNSENVDRFLQDFEVCLRSALNLKTMAGTLGNSITWEAFDWEDDQKPTAEIEISENAEQSK